MDGFQMIASRTFDTTTKLSQAWQVIAVEDRMIDALPEGIVHRITAVHSPGEHDCTIEGRLAGSDISAPGTRRLDTRTRTITELRHHATEDHLMTMAFARRPLRGTRITLTASFRPTNGVVNSTRLAAARENWDAEMARRGARLLQALQSAE